MSSMQSSLLFLLMLCLLSASQESKRSLSKPYGLHSTIEDTCVHLEWRHSHGNEPVDGYYVSVQAINAQKTPQAPDFIHVSKGARSTKLQGLWPDAMYKIKVIAFSDDHHAESNPITIRTTGLELLQARNLNISNIGTTKALFQWEHDARHTVHDTQFKLFCRGVRQFLDKKNMLVEESDDIQHSVYASSQGKETYFASNLQSNTKYSCHVTTIAEKVKSPPTPEVTFSTAYGIPLPPPQPTIKVHDNSSFTISFYHTVEQFGPISHYKIFAVPVTKDTSSTTVATDRHFVPTVSTSKLLTVAILPQLLNHKSNPAPFLVGTYSYKDLPRTITFTGKEMRSSFKTNTHYSFITAVFSKSEVEGMEGLHSFSAPANPPVFISKDLQEDWVYMNQPVRKHFMIIVVCTTVAVVLLFLAAFLSAFAKNYYRGKQRDAHFFALRDGDSSEEELYTKSSKKRASPMPSPISQPATAQLVAITPPPSPTPLPGESGAVRSHQAKVYVSGSPAEVPTTSMHSSPSPIAKHSSPLPKLQEHQATNQTPVTMLGIQDYLANKAGEPMTTAAKRNHQIPQPSKPSSSGTQREQSYYKKSPQKSDQKTGHSLAHRQSSAEFEYRPSHGRGHGSLKVPIGHSTYK